MKKFWDHIEYVYAAVCGGLAAWSFADGDAAGGWVCLGIGVLLIPVMQWIRSWNKDDEPVSAPERRALTWEQGEMEALRRVGSEPVPIPGEVKVHDPGNCQYCVVVDSDFQKGGKW